MEEKKATWRPGPKVQYERVYVRTSTREAIAELSWYWRLPDGRELPLVDVLDRAVREAKERDNKECTT